MEGDGCGHAPDTLQIQGQMIPSDLGGYQHLETGCSAPDDLIIVSTYPKVWMECSVLAGISVEHIGELFGWRVYRKMEVPHNNRC